MESSNQSPIRETGLSNQGQVGATGPSGPIYQEKIVIDLIKNQKWNEASKYGAQECYGAVINDKDFIWKQIIFYKKDDRTIMNPTLWGNLAILIYHGEKFSHRHDKIKQIKQNIIKTLDEI